VFPGSSRAAPASVAVQGAKKDAKGSKSMQKWHPQWVVATANYDDGDKKKADGSDKKCVMPARHSVKRQVQPQIDHFVRLLEEACPNHAYPVKHKLKDNNMMKNFITLGSLTQDKEPKEDPVERGVLVFLSHRIICKRTDANCSLHPGVFQGIESTGKQ
jgi:hypothetical protein